MYDQHDVLDDKQLEKHQKGTFLRIMRGIWPVFLSFQFSQVSLYNRVN